jgi:hypothetical protein
MPQALCAPSAAKAEKTVPTMNCHLRFAQHSVLAITGFTAGNDSHFALPSAAHRDNDHKTPAAPILSPVQRANTRTPRHTGREGGKFTVWPPMRVTRGAGCRAARPCLSLVINRLLVQLWPETDSLWSWLVGW